MESYTIICDASERPNESQTYMDCVKLRNVVKRVRLWSFIQSFVQKLQPSKSESNSMEMENSDLTFHLDSESSRQARKNNMDDLMNLKEIIAKNTIPYNQPKLNFFVETLVENRTRKTKRNICKKIQTSSIHNFKAIRKSIGYHKVRRNPFVISPNINFTDILLNRKRKFRDLSDSSSSSSSYSSSEPSSSSSNSEYQVPENLMENICKFHGNMVREHPKKQRTQVEQERRDKNTEACRMTRRAKKLEEAVLEGQYNEKLAQYKETMKETIRSLIYIKELMALCENANGNNETETVNSFVDNNKF